jgi:multidrug resistance efflux pump
MRRTLAICLVAACAGSLSLLLHIKDNPSDSSAPALSEITHDLPEHTIQANGTVEGNTREIPLRFEIAGRLKAVDVYEGSEVRAGDTLARLEQDSWVHALSMSNASLALAKSERDRVINGARTETRELAEAQVQTAKARANQIRKRLDRALRLFERNAIAQQELDDLSVSMDVAQSEVDAADARAREICAPARGDEISMADAKVALEQAKCAQAEAQLAKTTLVAPRNGIVLRVHNEPGELVGPETSLPCLIMVEAQNKRVRAYVEEMDAPAVVVGRRAYAVADGMPTHHFWGNVTSCAPSMMPKKYFNNAPGERVDVKVREVVIELDECDDLVIGLPVDVYIEPGNARPDSIKPIGPLSVAPRTTRE